ncbi:MAG: YaiO family outer membrane beta-barrel protein [Candidatus Melainabacteria bacterium]|nr:YaiO family outer membrane beta-barrel protein [Candidatus Melainabacteria bacterium]
MASHSEMIPVRMNGWLCGVGLTALLWLYGCNMPALSAEDFRSVASFPSVEPADVAEPAALPVAQPSQTSSTKLDFAWSQRDDFLKSLTPLAEAMPAKQQQLEAWLQQYPKDAEARFMLARLLAWQRRFNLAREQYERLMVEVPANADHLLGLAQVFLWNNQAEQALPLLAQAKQLSPNYEAVYQAELQALSQLNQTEALASARLTAAQKFPLASWHQPPESTVAEEAQPEADKSLTGAEADAATALKNSDDSDPNRPVVLEVGGEYENLSRQFNGWNAQYGRLTLPVLDRGALYGQFRRTDRFNQSDYELAGGAFIPLGRQWLVQTEASLSPTNDVLPKWSLSGGIQRKLPLGFVAQAVYRHTEYDTAITEMGIYTLEHYWRNWRTAYTLYQSYLHSARQAFSHMGQISYYYGEHNAITLTGALGQELENIGVRGVLATNVRAVSLSGVHFFRPRWGLTYQLLLQQQGDIYTRRGVQLGLRYLL